MVLPRATKSFRKGDVMGFIHDVAQIRQDVSDLKTTLNGMATIQEAMALGLRKLLECLCSEVTGIVVHQNKETQVAKAKCTVVKGSPKSAMKAGPSVKLAAGTFQLLDGGQGSFKT